MIIKRAEENLSKTTFRIFETSSFQKECQKNISALELKLVQKKCSEYIYPQLRKEPHYGTNIKKLKDYDTETYRYRIGNLRLFYSIDEKEKVVIITAIRHRKIAYR